MKTTLFAGASVGLCILASATAASAQSIDYGAMEQLFNEPVTTSATGSPQRSTEVPVDMQIISAAEIKRSGASDLPAILSRVAGLDVLNWGAAGADVSVRGYNQAMSPRLLVLINGRQVYLDHYGYTAWATLPVQLDEIRQIEVVKGPNSALFGFNAVGGVVNIITFNPKYDSTNVVTARVGTEGQREVSLVHTAKLGDNLAARLSFGAREENEWENTIGAPAYGVQDPSRINLSVDAIANLTPKTELRFEATTSNVGLSSMTSVYGYSGTKYLTSSAKVSLATESKIGSLEFSAYQNSLTGKYRLSGGIPAVFDNKITVLSAQDLFKIGARHTFRVGFEHRHNTIDTAPLRGGTVSYDVNAFSGMWNWAVTDQFSLTAAARADKMALERTGSFPVGFPLANNALWDRDINETSYNLGAVWRATSADTVRATAARGVQVPTLVDLGGLQLYFPVGPFTVAVMGYPKLQPTVVTNYELAYDRTLPAINGRAGVKLFTQKTEDVKGQLSSSQLDVAPTATTYPALSYRNVGDSKMSGVEVSATGKYATGLHWSGDYTWTDVSDDPAPGYNPAVRLTDFAHSTPKGRGNLIVGWEKGPWTVDGHLRYVSEFTSWTSTTQSKVKGFATLSGRVAHSLDNGFTVALSGQNLLDDSQRQTTGLYAERRVQLTLSKSW